MLSFIVGQIEVAMSASGAAATSVGHLGGVVSDRARRAAYRVHRPVLVGFAACCMLYLVSRLALIWRLPVFWDEGFYAAQAQSGFDDPAHRFDFLGLNKPPLFSWVSSAFVSLGLPPLTAVRGVSFVAGAATLVTSAVLARRIGGTACALVTALLYVIVPFFLVYDSYGLIDGLATATMMVTLYVQVRLAERPRVATALLLGLVMGAALLTRPLGALALVLLPVSLLLFDWRAAQRRRRLAIWVGCVLIAVALAELLHSVLLLSPLYEQGSRLNEVLHNYRPLGSALSDPFGSLSTNWPGFSAALTGYITWPGLALFVVGVGFAFKRRNRLALLLGIWTAAPIVATFVLLPYGFPRYLLAGIPPLLVLAGFAVVDGAAFLRARMKPRTFSFAVPVAALALALPALRLDGEILSNPSTARYPSEDTYQFVAGWPAGTRLDEVAADLKALAGPGRTVVAAIGYPPWNLAAHFDHPHIIPPLNTVPIYDGIRAGASGGRTFEFFAAGTTPAAANAEFILQHDTFGVPPGISLDGYQLIASFPRPYGGTFGGRPQPVVTIQLYQRKT